MIAPKRFRSLIFMSCCFWICAATDPDTVAHAGDDRLSAEQRTTIETIRRIAIAVESYAIDENRYPGPTDGAVTISFLSHALVPKYLKAPDWEDGWDHTFRFCSDESHYVIVSYGSDGIPDHEDWGDGAYDQERLTKLMCGGPAPGTRRDIVFMDGEFCQYPDEGIDP